MNDHSSRISHSNGVDNREEASLAGAIAALNRTFSENQRATIQILSEISSRVERLEGEGSASSQVCVERATVRLDGLEVYAVVSALTMATSLQCFDSHGGMRGWDDLMRDGKYLQMGTELIFLCCSAMGLVAGMHATLVFSLMTMYGRTAVGIGTDKQFLDFFQVTGRVRFRGFQTFRASLYLFLVQLLLMVIDKCPHSLRVIGVLSLSYAFYEVYSDTQRIIEAATKILFSKPEPKKPELNEAKKM